MKTKQDEHGFSALEGLLILIIVGLIGFVGWYIWSNRAKPSENATTSQNAPTASQNQTVQDTLVIKEWGVKLPLNATLKQATYKIATYEPYYKNVAFLSTKAQDDSPICQKYYSNTPSFQYIVRYAPEDQFSIREGQASISAKEATVQAPATYKLVDNYVYFYHSGNGEACPDANGEAVFKAYTAAFASLKPAN